jgi:hypothetical protein
MLKGATSTDDYKDQGKDLFMEELAVYDEMDTTYPR